MEEYCGYLNKVVKEKKFGVTQLVFVSVVAFIYLEFLRMNKELA